MQDDWTARRDLTINAGLRIEAATVPVDPRDVNMPDLLAPAPTVGPLYQNPGATFSPRLGAAWNIGGSDRTSVRGGYGLYYTLNNQQDLIVTVTNPPATPRVVIGTRRFRCRRSSVPAASRCARSRTTSTTRASTCGT